MRPAAVSQAVAAISAQARTLISPSPAYYNDVSLKLAKALVDKSCFDEVFFANSGAEANEGAIKLARRYGSARKNGAFEIITFEGAFHGRTLATMSASGKKAFEPLFEPKVSGFRKARLNDLEIAHDDEHFDANRHYAQQDHRDAGERGSRDFGLRK